MGDSIPKIIGNISTNSVDFIKQYKAKNKTANAAGAQANLPNLLANYSQHFSTSTQDTAAARYK
ncbi:hypothetical protein HDR58_09400 [bacterium]|nr:hypothetical protein [bacterium]